MKKIIFVFMLALTLVIITGCGDKQPVDENGVPLQDVSYDDLSTFYNQDFYHHLPASIYNQGMKEQYENVDFGQLYTDIIAYDPSQPTYPVPPIEPINVAELSKSELSDLTFDTLQQNVEATGPVDVIYSNLATVDYLMQLVNMMNQEFEEYGDIAFDGSVITIPSPDFIELQDPLQPGEMIDFDDITAEFKVVDGVSTILVHTVNSYTYQDEYMGTLTGELGLYLKVGFQMDENNVKTTTIQFNLTTDLSANVEGMGTADVAYNIGYFVKATDNTSVVVNSSVDTTVNYQISETGMMPVELPESLNESISVDSSFVYQLQNDGIVAEFKVSTDALDTAELNYQVTADSNGAIVYMNGEVTDEDFYGVDVPSQLFNVVFVYDELSELVFVGGDVDLNIPTYDEFGYMTGTEEIEYTAYAWNLNNLDGWTNIVKDETSGFYELYNDGIAILDSASQESTFDSNGKLIESEQIIAGGVMSDSSEYTAAAYIHIKEGNTLSISLPITEGSTARLTSNNFDQVSDAYTELNTFTDNMIIDLSQSQYQVPELDKSLFTE